MRNMIVFLIHVALTSHCRRLQATTDDQIHASNLHSKILLAPNPEAAFKGSRAQSMPVDSNNIGMTIPKRSGWTAVVIGAGPAGLALSLGLSRLEGCDRVHLVEKRSAFEARGANFMLAPNGLKALEELCPGIGVDMRKVGIESNMVPKYPAILMPWWMMRDVLLDNVRKQMGDAGVIELHMGKSLNRIIQDNESVSVHFENDEMVLQGEMLVGADGVNSAVREQLHLPETVRTGVTAFRGHVEDARDFEEISELLERGFIPLGGNFGIDGVLGSVFNYHPKLPGKLAWVVGTKDPVVPGETTPLSILDPAKSIEKHDELQLFRALIQRTSEPDIHYEPFPEGRVVNFSEPILKQCDGRWGGRDRVTLIGDAAHAFPSADGQGGSQAFEDAIVLTRLLANKSEQHSIQEVLSMFERERLPRVKTVHNDQCTRFENFMKGKTEPWSQDFMEWVFEGV